MEELLNTLNDMQGRYAAIEVLNSELERFEEKWKYKKDIPLTPLGEDAMIIFFPKEDCIKKNKEKVALAEQYLAEDKQKAVKIMQRLIEEWTSTR